LLSWLSVETSQLSAAWNSHRMEPKALPVS
jgi:hypothetical protein